MLPMSALEKRIYGRATWSRRSIADAFQTCAVGLGTGDLDLVVDLVDARFETQEHFAHSPLPIGFDDACHHATSAFHGERDTTKLWLRQRSNLLAHSCLNPFRGMGFVENGRSQSRANRRPSYLLAPHSTSEEAAQATEATQTSASDSTTKATESTTQAARALVANAQFAESHSGFAGPAHFSPSIHGGKNDIRVHRPAGTRGSRCADGAATGRSGLPACPGSSSPRTRSSGELSLQRGSAGEEQGR